jgi:hypothetical protein
MLIVKKQKGKFVRLREQGMQLKMMKENPQAFWRELQTQKLSLANDITLAQWFSHVRKLHYNPTRINQPP